MKAIIFDFNGTLFFDNDKHIKAWGAISKLIRNKDNTEEEIHTKLNGVPNNRIIQYFMDGKATSDDLNHYSLLKEEYYRNFCREDKESFHLVKGVEEFFESLKENNIKMTIASASIKPNIDFFVESFGLDKWMNPEEIVYDDGTYENKVAMFKKAAEVLNVPIEDCVVYEDSFSGIKNAYTAGCRQIIVVCPKEKEDEYQHLPGVIKTIQDFKNETARI